MDSTTTMEARTFRLNLPSGRGRPVPIHLVIVDARVEVWHNERFLACFNRDTLRDFFDQPYETEEINGVAFLADPDDHVRFYVRELVPATRLHAVIVHILEQTL